MTTVKIEPVLEKAVVSASVVEAIGHIRVCNYVVCIKDGAGKTLCTEITRPDLPLSYPYKI